MNLPLVGFVVNTSLSRLLDYFVVSDTISGLRSAQ